MPEVKWTNEQLQAIEEKDKNILVSAAAGSGKTAVLVERIINKILNENVDIDKVLIVTFTSAAASEMRERILEAIYIKLEEEPNNTNLQKQLILLNKANISTIHAFCLNVIKNNFFEIGVSPDFRIAESAEIELLKIEVLDDLLEDLYEENDNKIIKITEAYSGYKGDENLKNLIFNIYNYIQSTPFPMKWLNEQILKFNISNTKKDFSETEWGKIVLSDYRENISNNINELETIKVKLEEDIELQKYYRIICDDIEALKQLLIYNEWDKSYEVACNFKLKTWPSDKKILSELKEIVKEQRKTIRENTKKIIDKTFICLSEQATNDIYAMYEILVILEDIINEFDKRFKEIKQTKNIMDFSDVEHYALNILTKQDENGDIIPSDIAKKYIEQFCEIAIDEYQDSNLVQEYILNTISNGRNLFMVGDVKQSIYKFRQARPELFLKKYEQYKLKENCKNGDSLKIQLFNNFRSREKVLEFVNNIFANIMSKKLGDIEYNKSEYLNYKANYEQIEQFDNIELHIIDNNKPDLEEDEIIEELEKTTLEAKFVAERIKEIINSDYNVWDKKLGYRKVKYKDIVVLLRSPNSVAPIYEKEISELNIPVFSDTNVKYLDSIEIETIMNLLKIIDNPLQDIPFVTVLRSYIGNFTDNELVEIRLSDRKCLFYESMLKAQTMVNDKLKEKIANFLEKLQKWQFEQEYMPLDEFIWKIYLDTGYFNYVSLMPNGEFRQANLKMLFEQAKKYENASFKGLFNFIKFIEKLKKNKGDLSSAKLIGENENVVRIMSIHKSKGLEFPVVFLSGTGKKFNFQDLKEDILLHQDLGLGPRYTNYERKISYDTLAKEALKIQTRNEIISEEMRLLYVALTRSKEKLIITGICNNAEKKKNQKLDILENIQEMSYLLVKKYNTYLDWIEFVSLKNDNGLQNIVDIKYHKKTELEKRFSTTVDNTQIYIKELLHRYNENKSDLEYINKNLNWEYPNIDSTKIEGKTSVSNISKNKIIKKVKHSNPKFINEQTKLTKGEIGTIVHLILQNINLKKIYTLKEVEEEIQKLVITNIISEQEYKSIKANVIYNFIQSDIAKRIRKAEVLFKEQPFYTYIKANEIYDTKSTENILVQGIIDLYFIEDDEIVLLDYKTDNLFSEKELIEKHYKQLTLYKKALEEALCKRVKQVYIYSTTLNKEILVD